MWLAGCSLVALASAALSEADGPWLLGFAAIMAAQAAVLAGRAARLPPLVAWPPGFACVVIYALGYGIGDHVAYLGLAVALMFVVDRFAAVSVGLSAFYLRDGAVGTRTLRSTTLVPPDPIARDFARVRRERSPLAVACISVAAAPGTGNGRVVRGSPHRLARIARVLVPYLRVTDAVVRVADGSVFVVMPGADLAIAMAVLART